MSIASLDLVPVFGKLLLQLGVDLCIFLCLDQIPARRFLPLVVAS